MIGFEGRGAPIESVDFDFDAVDEALSSAISPNKAANHPTSQHAEAELAALKTILEWVVQKVPKNQNGIEIRATIAAWIFLPYLRTMNLTEIAATVGRDKQSLGRWVDDFKRRWPGVHVGGRS